MTYLSNPNYEPPEDPGPYRRVFHNRGATGPEPVRRPEVINHMQFGHVVGEHTPGGHAQPVLPVRMPPMAQAGDDPTGVNPQIQQAGEVKWEGQHIFVAHDRESPKPVRDPAKNVAQGLLFDTPGHDFVVPKPQHGEEPSQFGEIDAHEPHVARMIGLDLNDPKRETVPTRFYKADPDHPERGQYDTTHSVYVTRYNHRGIPTSDRVGVLDWDAETGEVKRIVSAHSGVGTYLWDQANRMAQETPGVVRPRHSSERTPQGIEWSRKMMRRDGYDERDIY